MIVPAKVVAKTKEQSRRVRRNIYSDVGRAFYKSTNHGEKDKHWDAFGIAGLIFLIACFMCKCYYRCSSDCPSEREETF